MLLGLTAEGFDRFRPAAFINRDFKISKNYVSWRSKQT
jgi:hypothetical protein